MSPIFPHIEKTHQTPKCKACNRPFPRLDQGTMLCDYCKLGNNLNKWLTIKKQLKEVEK